MDHAASGSAPSSSLSGATCPVDHGALKAAAPSSADKCPVDHSTRSSLMSWFTSGSTDTPEAHSSSQNTSARTGGPPLPTEREVSSIPRVDGSNWVYPSESQFFAAMARKNHNPQAPDMKVIVPIHNAVNERAWAEVKKWEAGQGGEKCGGVKLVSFKGRPSERTPKARWKMLLGYSAPFDRHDWIVDRCGTRMRYVIDFYAGRSPNSQVPSFYLDVRPALDNWEGVRMRAERFWERWVGSMWNSNSRPTPSAKTNT
ncbi:cytochrome c and c1 heme-lyase [Panus rudis PR-1116 ss-1]|nr:cytochrome c and c1 heme-lyase [Panus rudis PR-1116 ss-1]